MKPAIFIPDDLGARFDRVAKKNGMNRSEFFQKAGVKFADELEDAEFTDQLNVVIKEVGQEPSLFTAASARTLIDSGAWEW